MSTQINIKIQKITDRMFVFQPNENFWGEDTLSFLRANSSDSNYAQALFQFDEIEEISFNPRELRIKTKSISNWKEFVAKVGEKIKSLATTQHEYSAPTQSEDNTENQKENLSEIREIIQKQIAPVLAQHGGSVDIVNFENGILNLKFSGGCQGCSQITTTLKQGIEKILKDKIPGLIEIRDVTDHTQGDQAYYK